MKNLTCASLIGLSCSAVAIAGMVGLGLGSGTHFSADGSEMQTGVTVTPGPPNLEPPMMSAAPQIKGPAPLPTEEQGLPG